MSNNKEVNTEILQDMAAFYGKIYGLPPLAAKIYSFLVFDFEKKGVTFEDLVDFFSASKSSVSSGLNLLLKQDLIKNSELSNGRKRFFVLNDEFVKIRFLRIVEKMQNEIEILDRLYAYRNSLDDELNEKYGIYKSLLNKNIQNIQDSLRKLYNEE